MTWDIDAKNYECGYLRKCKHDGIFCEHRQNNGNTWAVEFALNLPKCKKEDCPLKKDI